MDFLSIESLARSLCIPSTLALGLCLSRRLLGLSNFLEIVIVGAALGSLQGLLLLDVLLRARLGLEVSLALLGPLALLLAAGVYRWTAPPPPWAKNRRSSVLALLMLAGLVVVVTNSAQLFQADDDFWLHAPLQGHMLRGEFPPANPFFSNLALQAHYGRDLMIVAGARVLGTDLITAQAVVTTWCQVLGFSMLAVLLWRFAGGRAATVLGVINVGLGVNMGYMTGMLQFHRNNSAVVSLSLLTAFYLLVILWERPSPRLAVLLGSVLGALSFIYETHFGLILLAGTTVAVLRWARRPKELLPTAASCLLGLLLACVAGGAFTALASRYLTGDEGMVSPALLNQGQRASMSFPKRPFLGLRVAPGDTMVSASYQCLPLSALFAPLDHAGARYDERYVPLWSWAVLRMHGLPLLLLPFTLLVLWKRPNACGLLFLAFGAWAYVIPGMIDFGPVHEYEYFRWEFAASFGFCGAFSVALAQLWKSGGRLTAMLVGMLVCLNILPGGSFALKFLAQSGQDGYWRTLSLQTMPTEWLRRQALTLHLREGDVQALTWLSGQTRPGERVLVNFGESDPWEILFESTLAGLTGLYPEGHELPRPDDVVGHPPFRMRPSYRNFLNAPTEKRLAYLRLDWLYLRLPPGEEAGRFDQVRGLRKAFERRTASNRIVIYRVLAGSRDADSIE